MGTSNFIDHVKISCRSGKGGAGSVHFRREKFIPKGGPDGGDGGRGGNIILKGNSQLWTLLHLRYKKHAIAGDGKPGAGNTKTGSYGADLILEVPLGTVVRDAETGNQRLEITQDGEELIITPGGRGGQGNEHYKSATKQAPRYAQPGEPGIEEWIVLELKLLADVGLVGFPNAGKSTLLSVISAAKPEIADYPFTTLVPNLGVVSYRDFKSFVVADIPGIIEGAAKGKGLGTRFLRHIERNSILLFLIPSDSDDIFHEYDILLKELEQFNPELLDKNRILGISKADVLDLELKEELSQEMIKSLPADLPWMLISSMTMDGIGELKDLIWKTLNS